MLSLFTLGNLAQKGHVYGFERIYWYQILPDNTN